MNTYKLLLQSRGHELFTASDGEECISIFEKIRKQDLSKPERNARTPFDAVILDYRMPKKDGLQVAGQILSVVPEKRIIIASAYVHELIENDIRKTDYARIEMLQKPFELDILLRLVEGNSEPPQGKLGQKSSVSGGRVSPSELDVEKGRIGNEEFMFMDKKTDDFFGIPF